MSSQNVAAYDGLSSQEDDAVKFDINLYHAAGGVAENLQEERLWTSENSNNSM